MNDDEDPQPPRDSTKIDPSTPDPTAPKKTTSLFANVSEFITSVTKDLQKGDLNSAAQKVDVVLGDIMGNIHTNIHTMSETTMGVLKAGKKTFADIAGKASAVATKVADASVEVLDRIDDALMEGYNGAIGGLNNLVDMCGRDTNPLVKAIKNVAQGFTEFIKHPDKPLASVTKYVADGLKTLYNMSIGKGAEHAR